MGGDRGGGRGTEPGYEPDSNDEALLGLPGPEALAPKGKGKHDVRQDEHGQVSIGGVRAGMGQRDGSEGGCKRLPA
jgi:hypothetical protein